MLSVVCCIVNKKQVIGITPELQRVQLTVARYSNIQKRVESRFVWYSHTLGSQHGFSEDIGQVWVDATQHRRRIMG